MNTSNLAQLYEKDETAWLDEMAQLVKEQQLEMIDFQNLYSFLWDMAQRDRREVLSRLKILLVHKLKLDFQPEQRSSSCRNTILEQQDQLQDLLESKTLYRHAQEILAKAFGGATSLAARETGIDEKKFPKECPLSLEQLLGENLLS